MLILAVSSCFSVIGKMSSHGMSALNSSVIHSHDEVSDDDVKSSIFLKHDVKHNAADHSHENPVLPFSDVSTLNIKKSRSKFVYQIPNFDFYRSDIDRPPMVMS